MFDEDNKVVVDKNSFKLFGRKTHLNEVKIGDTVVIIQQDVNGV